MARFSKRIEQTSVLVGDNPAKIALHIWEPSIAKRTVICMHGFVGTGQDFGPLAEALAQEGIKVIAPDLFGRGQSSFLMDLRYYNLNSQKLPIQAAMRMAVGPTCYLGSSAGGLMAMVAVQVRRWRSAGLILNDVPIMDNDDVQSFRDQLIEECSRTFASRDEAAEYLLQSRAMTYLEGDWREQFIDGRLMQINGEWRMRVDPALAEGLRRRSPFSIERGLRQAPIPVLMSFGEKSPYVDDPLNKEIAAANPNITLLEMAGDPHPPALMKQDQISAVAGFLAQCFSQADSSA